MIGNMVVSVELQWFRYVYPLSSKGHPTPRIMLILSVISDPASDRGVCSMTLRHSIRPILNPNHFSYTPTSLSIVCASTRFPFQKVERSPHHFRSAAPSPSSNVHRTWLYMLHRSAQRNSGCTEIRDPVLISLCGKTYLLLFNHHPHQTTGTVPTPLHSWAEANLSNLTGNNIL